MVGTTAKEEADAPRTEQAVEAGEPMEVRRHAHVIATLSSDELRGTVRVRRWLVTMADGTLLNDASLSVAGAERLAIAAALKAER